MVSILLANSIFIIINICADPETPDGNANTSAVATDSAESPAGTASDAATKGVPEERQGKIYK